MTIKNEEKTLGRCLSHIHDLFDSITVVDTGSTDLSIDILRSGFGILPIFWHGHENTENKSWEPHARNLSLKLSPSNWVLVLDADEVISREDILKIKSITPDVDGYFIRWANERYTESFDDYKLALFHRPAVNYDGDIHCNPQPSFRRQGLKAKWLPGITINHMQEMDRPYRADRIERLDGLVAANPKHNRYKWFLGYTALQHNQENAAVRHFSTITPAVEEVYPVECLNAYVVLASVYAGRGDAQSCSIMLKIASQFYQAHQNDFEVRVNTWIAPWLIEASRNVSSHALNRIRAPQFAL